MRVSKSSASASLCGRCTLAMVMGGLPGLWMAANCTRSLSAQSAGVVRCVIGQREMMALVPRGLPSLVCACGPQRKRYFFLRVRLCIEHRAPVVTRVSCSTATSMLLFLMVAITLS